MASKDATGASGRPRNRSAHEDARTASVASGIVFEIDSLLLTDDAVGRRPNGPNADRDGAAGQPSSLRRAVVHEITRRPRYANFTRVEHSIQTYACLGLGLRGKSGLDPSTISSAVPHPLEKSSQRRCTSAITPDITIVSGNGATMQISIAKTVRQPYLGEPFERATTWMPFAA